MKKDINSNNEELVDKVFKILTKFKNNPKKIENIFTELFEKDFDFIHDVGSFFHKYVDQIITKNKDKNWTQEDRKRQLIKRGRYVEFNLLYDRGTKFGLETGGNTEAILMSLPPLAEWE